MSYRDHDYMSPTGTHPIGSHATTGGSKWGVIVVLAIIVGMFVLAIIYGPDGEQTGAGTDVPAMEQTAPVADPAASGDFTPAPAQSMD